MYAHDFIHHSIRIKRRKSKIDSEIVRTILVHVLSDRGCTVLKKGRGAPKKEFGRSENIEGPPSENGKKFRGIPFDFFPRKYTHSFPNNRPPYLAPPHPLFKTVWLIMNNFHYFCWPRAVKGCCSSRFRTILNPTKASPALIKICSEIRVYALKFGNELSNYKTNSKISEYMLKISGNSKTFRKWTPKFSVHSKSFWILQIYFRVNSKKPQSLDIFGWKESNFLTFFYRN